MSGHIDCLFANVSVKGVRNLSENNAYVSLFVERVIRIVNDHAPGFRNVSEAVFFPPAASLLIEGTWFCGQMLTILSQLYLNPSRQSITGPIGAEQIIQ
jgi:hypothetical protein